jgi:hypothetical protein
MRTRFASLVLILAPVCLAAQAPKKTAPATVVPAAQQVAAAVLALPKEFRADARVLGYAGTAHELTTIREGKGPFICLANDPAGKQFHVACYHESLEPFMARGRALRASGAKGEQVDTARFAEVRAGTLAMPKQATLYQLFGPAGSFDPVHGTAKKAKPLIVIYMPGATVESSGLSAQPADGLPWIMLPGTPKAHIMLEPKM